jgi:hypothetical protein
MDAFVGGQDQGDGFVLHGLGMDVVAVVVIEDEEFVNVELVVGSSCRDKDVCVNHVLVHWECLVGLSQ